jgi:hypothetical protein
MADEIGPIPQAGKVVFYNPDDPDQVRNVTTAAWVNLTAATFADCDTDLAQKGTTGKYYADLPAGLSATREYPFELYASTATAFTDDAELMEYKPETTPTTVSDEVGESGGLSEAQNTRLTQVHTIIQGHART